MVESAPGPEKSPAAPAVQASDDTHAAPGPAVAPPAAEALPSVAPPPPAPRPLRPAEGVSGRANARMTLAGTALVFTVTLLAWGGAKVACNLHPPRYEAFEPAPLTKLTSTPKDAAIEFHHRLALRNFQGAREIAAASAVGLVQDAEENCDEGCLAERSERELRVVTRAIVERREGPTAIVRAEAFYDGRVDARRYELRWEERMWKVTGVAQ